MATLQHPAVWPLLVLAAVGGWRVLRHRVEPASGVILSWGAVSIALSLYSLAVERSPLLPALVPAYHFEFQVRAWAWLLIGIGLWHLVNRAAERIASTRPWVATVSGLGGCVLSLAVLYPAYLHRSAFVEAPAIAKDLGAAPDRVMSAWIRTSTPAGSVILASDEDGLLMVAAGGRRLVCVDAFFSNPYISHEARRRDRDQMFTALSTGDWATFDRLAKQYQVSYVLARGDRASTLLAQSRFVPRFWTSELTLFSVVR
jgi:hypothetical protein